MLYNFKKAARQHSKSSKHRLVQTNPAGSNQWDWARLASPYLQLLLWSRCCLLKFIWSVGDSAKLAGLRIINRNRCRVTECKISKFRAIYNIPIRCTKCGKITTVNISVERTRTCLVLLL